MKKGKLVSVIAALAAIAIFNTAVVPVQATSRTTTTEVVGVGRDADEAAQVLGTRRSSVSTDNVTTGKITDNAALEVLKSLQKVAEVVKTAFPDVQTKAEDFSVLDSMEITAVAGTEVSEAKPLFVSFSFPGVTKDTKAYVFHYENKKWVVVPTTVSEGVIVGKFTSLSPVAIVVDKNTLKGSVLGAARATSPRTGDSRLFIIVIAAMCLAIVASANYVFKKKAR